MIKMIKMYKVGTQGARCVINMPAETEGKRFTRKIWADGKIVFEQVKEIEQHGN